MPISFDSQQEANEYAKQKQDEGYAVQIIKYNNKYNTYLLAKGYRKKSEKELIESGIPNEHIIYYNRPIDSLNEENPFGLSIKPEVDSQGRTISPHVLLSHELAHQKLKHSSVTNIHDTIKQEEDAWKLASEKLKSAGEWNEKEKEDAIISLASYYHALYQKEDKNDKGIITENRNEDIEKARSFINSL
jgi:hypothetical protein